MLKKLDQHQDVKNPKTREKYGKLAGYVGIITNLALFAVKFAVGTLFSSVSIIADGINNLADSASSIITLIGFKLSSKPADEKHPFGHARIEYLAGVFISFLIVIIGFQLGENSVLKIINPTAPELGAVAFIALAVSVLVKIWQCLFNRKIGKLINSKTVMATSLDSKNDAIATSAVLVAALITKYLNINLDGIMGLAVALMIIYSGIKMVVDTSNPLLGEKAEKNLREEISQNIMKYEEILGIHDLVVHNYGAGKCYASVHCELCASKSVMESHDLVDGVERDFKTNHGINLVIHMDPIVTDDEKTNAMRAKVKAIISAVYPDVTIHDFRVVWSSVSANIVFDINVPFAMSQSDEIIIKTIDSLIKTVDENYSTIITVDRI